MKKYHKYILILLIILLSLLFTIKNREEPVDKLSEPKIKLYLTKNDQVLQLELEDYLIGTVAAEMPASFELEALKAQAVCARTYALRKLLTSHKYPRQADLSDDIYSCQAYIAKTKYDYWQPELVSKIRKAVTQTRGQIMIYDNQPIDALYHSTCGGQTESALNGWGKDIPYLQSVKCKYCRGTKHYQNVSRITLAQLSQSLGYTRDKIIPIEILTRTSTGRVKEIKIGAQVISGEKFRQIYNLPSTWFYLKTDGGSLIIKSNGYGHGSGMCQWGANGMARAGKDYKQILNTYYKNIEFYQINY
ncbi:MAG: stage II sporulation protein D [Syntrophomonas sp.]